MYLPRRTTTPYTESLSFQLNPIETIGPTLIGSYIEFFFLGVTCTQFYTYKRYFPRDATWIKRLVDVTLVLSILRTFQTFWTEWIGLVVHFGAWVPFTKAPWDLYISPVTAVLLTSVPQCFFIWRCFSLVGRSKLFLAFLSSLLLAVLAFSIAVSVQYATDLFDFRPVMIRGLTMIALSLLLDTIITVTMTIKLTRSRQLSKIKRTRTLLNKLILLTLETAAPPLLSQTATIIVILLSRPEQTNWYIMCTLITPRLYVFALMCTLNARAHLHRPGPTFQTTRRQDDRNEKSLEANCVSTNVQFNHAPGLYGPEDGFDSSGLDSSQLGYSTVQQDHSMELKGFTLDHASQQLQSPYVAPPGDEAEGDLGSQRLGIHVDDGIIA